MKLLRSTFPIWLFFLAGCPTANGPCETNTECAGNELCIDGSCLVTCEQDNECSDEESCNAGVCQAGISNPEPVSPEPSPSPTRDAGEPDVFLDDAGEPFVSADAGDPSVNPTDAGEEVDAGDKPNPFSDAGDLPLDDGGALNDAGNTPPPFDAGQVLDAGPLQDAGVPPPTDAGLLDAGVVVVDAGNQGPTPPTLSFFAVYQSRIPDRYIVIADGQDLGGDVETTRIDLLDAAGTSVGFGDFVFPLTWDGDTFHLIGSIGINPVAEFVNLQLTVRDADGLGSSLQAPVLALVPETGFCRGGDVGATFMCETGLVCDSADALDGTCAVPQGGAPILGSAVYLGSQELDPVCTDPAGQDSISFRLTGTASARLGDSSLSVANINFTINRFYVDFDGTFGVFENTAKLCVSDANGSGTFTFTVSDEAGRVSNSAQVTFP